MTDFLSLLAPKQRKASDIREQILNALTPPKPGTDSAAAGQFGFTQSPGFYNQGLDEIYKGAEHLQPTPEQVQRYQRMSPEQRKKLWEEHLGPGTPDPFVFGPNAKEWPPEYGGQEMQGQQGMQDLMGQQGGDMMQSPGWPQKSPYAESQALTQEMGRMSQPMLEDAQAQQSQLQEQFESGHLPPEPPIDQDMIQGEMGMDALGGGEGIDRPGEVMGGKGAEWRSKSVGWLERGVSAENVLSQPEYAQALTDFSEDFSTKFGKLGAWHQSPEFQVARRAASEFLAIVLRKDTGAAVTRQEFELYGPMFLPMPGDKPEAIKAKKEAREVFLRSLERGGGIDKKMADDIYNMSEPAPSADLSGMSDEDLLKMLGG